MSQAANPTDNPTEPLAATKRFFKESDHPLAKIYRKRVRQNRDLVTLITDSSNDRGTGKSTLSLRLAYGMDRTGDGITEEKVSITPHQLTNSYIQQPKGSGLVLDESEVGVDKYRAGSAVNKSIRDLVSTGRVKEKYLVLNAPADHLVDTDLKSLVDIWILVKRRGFAHVYRMDWNPHQGHPLTRGMGTLEWKAIPAGTNLKRIYNVLDREKDDLLEGKQDALVTESELKDRIDRAEKDAKKEKRDELIRAMVNHGLTQTETAEIVGMSQAAVSGIMK